MKAMITFQVDGEVPLPNGERVLTGFDHGLSIDRGDTCQMTVGDTTAEIVVTSVSVPNVEALKRRLVELLIRIQPEVPSLVGYTFTFHRRPSEPVRGG